MYAARQVNIAPERMALISVHAWDTHGASQAGLITGWFPREEKIFPSSMSAPDVESDTLEDVVLKLSRLGP